jgi:hypothetical protein
MVHTVHRSHSYAERIRDGQEITHPTDPDVIVLGYEGIIGGQERPIASRDQIRSAVLALKGERVGL